MINLLPDKEKEELILEKNKKLAIILSSALLVVIICLLLILMAVKFYILGKAVSQNFVLDQAKKEYQTNDFLNYKNILQNYNEELAEIVSFYKNAKTFNPGLKTVLNIKKPEGLYFSDLSMVKTSSNKIEVKISGISDTRDNLIIFKKSLEETKGVKNAVFSAESWVNPKNVNFYLTFEVD
jgi:hypothetical protein